VTEVRHPATKRGTCSVRTLRRQVPPHTLYDVVSGLGQDGWRYTREVHTGESLPAAVAEVAGEVGRPAPDPTAPRWTGHSFASEAWTHGGRS